MKKPSLTDALAHKAPGAAPAAEPTPAEKHKDARTTTTLRIAPALLEGLKIVAAKRRVRVNDLLLEGVAHVLALNGHKPQ